MTMSKLFTAALLAATLLSAGAASAAPNSDQMRFDAAKFFADLQRNGA